MLSYLTRTFLLSSLLILSYAGYGQQPIITSKSLDSLFLHCEKSLPAQAQSVLELGKALLTFSKKQNNIAAVAQSHYFIGRAYRALGENKKALTHLETSITLSKSINDPQQVCLSLKETGIIHYIRKESEIALRYYTEALAVAKKNNYQSEISALYNNIGNLYDSQKNYKQAITYYEEGLALHPKDNRKVTLLYNLGRAHSGNGDHETGMKYYQQSYDIAQKTNDRDAQISALNGIASIYWEQERDTDVLRVSFILLELQKNGGSAFDQIETLNRIGLSYLNTNQAVKSITYFKKALTLARATEYPSLHYIYANLAFAYERAKDYKQAYHFILKHKQLQDSIENLEAQRNLNEILARYEADKKEQQIAQLKLEKEMQALTLQKKDAELDRETLIRNSITIGSFMLIVIILVALLFYRQRMSSKIQLAAQSEEVNRQRTLELIREHELKTIKANHQGRENERLRISQELHDGVAGSLAGIKLQTRKIADEHNLQELRVIMQNIDSVYDEVRTLSHNLSPHKVLNTAFIDLLRSQLKQAGDQGSFTGEFTCYPEATLNQLPDNIKIEVYRILQELMANIIRHAQAKTVEVQFTLNDESLNLIVEDSGKGFDSSKITPGVGLNSIRNRVTSLEGTLHIESNPGRGTIVNVDIPISRMNLSITG